MIALEEHLIEAGPVVERPEGRLQALDSIVTPGMIEALVIDAANFERASEVAGYGPPCTIA